MRLAANLSTQFATGEWPDRVARAAALGFRAVEAQWPYGECEAVDLGGALFEHGMTGELVNAPVGEDGDLKFGLAAISGAEDAFRASIERALRFAETARFRRIHVLCGSGAGGRRDTLLDNLDWAAAQAGDTAMLVIEAINRRDVPGYHLAGVADAVDVLETLARPNLRLMFDFYHAWRNGEDIAATIGTHLSWIEHVQISDHPGRGEPGSGEIPFAGGLSALRRGGYEGAVGCEFRPTGPPADCLGWTRSLGFELNRGAVKR